MRVLIIADDKNQTSFDKVKAKVDDLCLLINHTDETLTKWPKTIDGLRELRDNVDKYDCVFIELPCVSLSAYSVTLNSLEFGNEISGTKVPVIILCRDEVGAAIKLTRGREHMLVIRDNNIFDTMRIMHVADWIADYRESKGRIADDVAYITGSYRPFPDKGSIMSQVRWGRNVSNEPRL